MENQKTLPETGLVRLPTILHHFQISRSGWYAGIQQGLYPQPIKVGRMAFWKAQDITALIERLSMKGAE